MQYSLKQIAPNKDQVVWITGASKGIGRALALEFAHQGYIVAASARNEEELQNLCRETESLMGKCLAFPLDVTDQQACKSVFNRITLTMGPVGQVVLNAGTHIPTPAHSFKSQDIKKLLDLNVLGVSYCLEEVLPYMLDLQQGQIAVVASVAGYRGLPDAAGYGASKAALINLCEALKLDLVGSGIKIQVINPGFVKTPLTDKNAFPMPFLISAEAAAKHIVKGMTKDKFEIRFPRLFTSLLGLLRILPYSWYFPLVGKGTAKKN